MKHKHFFKSVLILLLLSVGGQSLWAQNTFTVSRSNITNGSRFSISRSGDLTVADTVLYRTVSLSAFGPLRKLVVLPYHHKKKQSPPIREGSVRFESGLIITPC